jgi:hypothetical protein
MSGQLDEAVHLARPALQPNPQPDPHPAAARTPPDRCAHNDFPLRELERRLATLRFDTDATDDIASRAQALQTLCAASLDRLPLPGQGRTALRWSALAAVAACDLALVKLYEGHTDALAMLAELGAASYAVPHSRWGVWAAEPPQQKVQARTGSGRVLQLYGVKPWCSGAAALTHALVTVWRGDGAPVLAAVDLAQPSISVSEAGWRAVGMAATGTAEVRFDGAHAVQIGEPHAYVGRPGFWHGGAGIAACWYGSAAQLGSALRAGVARRRDPHACAHLGAVDTQLACVGALLRETAAWIDRYPRADAMRAALRARLSVERAATDVLAHVMRALGPGPLCGERKLARAAADLPVFLRQSHAERDEAALGNALAEAFADARAAPDTVWRLDDT